MGARAYSGRRGRDGQLDGRARPDGAPPEGGPGGRSKTASRLPVGQTAQREGTKRQQPKVPATGEVKIRGVPFTIGNPCTALHEQWWFTKYDTYKSKTDLCRWGGVYKKRRAFGTPSDAHTSGAAASTTTSQTAHFPPDGPATSTRLAEKCHIEALKGTDEVIHRNCIPGQLLRHFLKK